MKLKLHIMISQWVILLLRQHLISYFINSPKQSKNLPTRKLHAWQCQEWCPAHYISSTRDMNEKLIIMLHLVFLLALFSLFLDFFHGSLYYSVVGLSDIPGKCSVYCRVPCVCCSESTPYFSFNCHMFIFLFSCTGECSKGIFFVLVTL